MNWIERMYELNGKDLYSQNGEGYFLEYIFEHLDIEREFLDIGGGDFFYLSNTRHLRNLGWRPFKGQVLDKSNGHFITKENIHKFVNSRDMNLLSIDIDGNDYWILDEMLNYYLPAVIVCEFNSAFDDARTIKYNPDHVWDGTDYYGFSFKAAEKLAEENGYKIIFNLANMNLFMVRKDLIGDLNVPEVTYKIDNFFPHNDKGEWVFL